MLEEIIVMERNLQSSTAVMDLGETSILNIHPAMKFDIISRKSCVYELVKEL